MGSLAGPSSADVGLGALRGRRALVLGASGIVGEGIARSLLLAGADVVAPVRRSEQSARVLSRLSAWASAGGARVEVVTYDFSTSEGLAALRDAYASSGFDAVAASLGGHLPRVDVLRLTEEAFDEFMHLRVWSQVRSAQSLLGLVRPGGAYLVATGKLGQACSAPDLAAYTLASAAVYGVVNALRALAESETDGEKGVRVLELRLGLVLRCDEDPSHEQFPSSPSAPGTAAGQGAVTALLGGDKDGLLLWDDPRLMVTADEAQKAWKRTETMLEERIKAQGERKEGS